MKHGNLIGLIHSFDRSCVGKLHPHHEFIPPEARRVHRPEGMDDDTWYDHAGRICLTLNHHICSENKDVNALQVEAAVMLSLLTMVADSKRQVPPATMSAVKDYVRQHNERALAAMEAGS